MGFVKSLAEARIMVQPYRRLHLGSPTRLRQKLEFASTVQ